MKDYVDALLLQFGNLIKYIHYTPVIRRVGDIKTDNVNSITHPKSSEGMYPVTNLIK